MRAYRLSLYEKSMPDSLTLAQKLAAARRSGYDCMELSIDESDARLARLDWDDSEIYALRSESEEAGVSIQSICLSGHRRFPLGDPDEASRRRGFDIMQKAVAFAAKLGVRMIQLAGYDVYYQSSTEETRRLFAEGLARSAEWAAARGVTLAFETMETPFMNTVEKAMYWVNMVQSPYLQIYPDCGNLTNAAVAAGADVCADMAKGRGHIAGLHLKETKPDVFREVPYGEGHVDFAACVNMAWQLGVRYYNAEFWYTGEKNWEEICTANSMFLRKYLDAAMGA